MEFVITDFLGEAFGPSVFHGDGLRGRKDLGLHSVSTLGSARRGPCSHPRKAPWAPSCSEGRGPPSRQAERWVVVSWVKPAGAEVLGGCAVRIGEQTAAS